LSTPWRINKVVLTLSYSSEINSVLHTYILRGVAVICPQRAVLPIQLGTPYNSPRQIKMVIWRPFKKN
jgi:hypothetical protein